MRLPTFPTFYERPIRAPEITPKWCYGPSRTIPFHSLSTKKVGTSLASKAILQWVRDHESWTAPLVFFLSFLESFAFVSLIVPATFILLGIGALIGAAGIGFLPSYAGAVVGAFLGDWAAFELAVWLGPKVAGIWPISRDPTLLKQASEWFGQMGDCCSIFRSIFRPDTSGSSARCGRSANADDKISVRQSYVRADLGRRGANARIVWTKVATD